MIYVGGIEIQVYVKSQNTSVLRLKLTIMTSVSVFCCLKGCLDGFGFPKNVPHIPQENPIQLDTAFMGWNPYKRYFL